MKVSRLVMQKAHAEVARAKKNKLLIPQPCERCGAEKVEAHHEDYAKPLEVMWLCTKHHGERHSELGEALVDSKGELHISWDLATYKAIEKFAKTDNRSITAAIRVLVKEALMARKGEG